MSSNGWQSYKLKDICTKIGSGATPRGGKAAYLKEGPFALIRSQNVLDFFFSNDGLAFIDKEQADQLDNVELQENDVLLNITGDSVARVCQVPKEVLPARVNQHVSIVRPDCSKLLSEYLKYYLLSPGFKNYMLAMASVGGTRNALTKGMIEDFEIKLPPLPTQRRIADILSTLDEKIELNRQTNATLEAIAQAIFKEWFVDFNFPGATGEMQPSELGMIPKGWRLGQLGEMCNITMGQSPPGESYNEIGEGFPFYQGRADFTFRFPTKRVFTTDPKRFANKYDTLVSVRAPVGDMNIATEYCCIGRGLAAVIEKNGNHSFTYYFLKGLTNNFKSFEDNGTVFGSINKNDFEGMKCVIPTDKIITIFEEKCRPLDDVIFANAQQSSNLIQIRDSLLPKLMNGEIEA